MTRLLDVHRRDICSSMIQDAFAERKQRLAQEENALALRLTREVCGEDVFLRIGKVPEGWLPSITQIGLERGIGGSSYCNFADRATVPELMRRAIKPSLEWAEAFSFHRGLVCAMESERRELADLIAARLRSIGTKEKLETDWPAAFAFLRDPRAVASLPAVPIETIMERVERAKAA